MSRMSFRSPTCRRRLGEILALYGRVDALLNARGGNMPGATIAPTATVFDLKIEDYDRVLDLNLKGTLLPSLVFGKAMAAQGSGTIVNFSSMAAQRSITRVLGYSNAKAAVDNLTTWLAMEFARKHGDKIRVNAIAHGFFIAEQNRRLLTNPDGSLTERGKMRHLPDPDGPLWRGAGDLRRPAVPYQPGLTLCHRPDSLDRRRLQHLQRV
jgi:NAD(P)-dependent dehydrogenase (short-subunit alcohol dehydrogenase family)